MKPKRILITGGAGFIGSHLVRTCVQKGYDVTVLDNLSRGKKSNLSDVLRSIHLVTADIREFNTIIKHFDNIHTVINLAALNTGVDFDIGRTEFMFQENMLLQMNPIKAAARAKVSVFLQISSASVYSRHIMETRQVIAENESGGDPEPSKEGYAYAKIMGEKLAQWYGKNTPMKTVIVRPINVYGTGDNFDEMGHFIPTMIKKLLLAKRGVNVFGSGNQKRSYLAVGDLIEGLLLLAAKGKNGDTYNIDAQEEHSVKEIVLKIKKHIKKDVAIHFDKTKPEGSKRRMLDTTKIRSLGWTPKHTLIDTIPALIADIEKRLHETT
jgi:nucleoside-diphosphate-sugar epimerase